MEELISVLRKIEDISWLIAELEACGNECAVETVDELAEYLESELSYA